MRIAPEVKQALAEKKAVVALESTIISHGMPYPKNLETAYALEDIIREEGAVPATIGLVEGEIVIGLSHSEIEELAKRKGARKVSKRDLPIVMANGEWGATTVSGTILCASKAGIDVFATGGIGGVHRGAEKTFDVSRDLLELGSEPMLVVCSGAKAILDLPKTIEVLETQGVTVLSYESDSFASFYSRSSGLPVDYVFHDPSEAAKVLKARRDLELTGGILVSNPCPEDMAMDNKAIEKVIEEAIKEADKNEIHGKSLTPFLLSRIAELTKGDSLETNMALVKNNARLGARIAVAYAKME